MCSYHVLPDGMNQNLNLADLLGSNVCQFTFRSQVSIHSQPWLYEDMVLFVARGLG